jgi:hypothetical protein
MSYALTLRAGPEALRILRERGLRAEDVDVIPAAAGGPKWLVLAGLDRYLFGEFFAGPRNRPLHLIGSSSGSWRLACLAQRDPVAALDRKLAAYLQQEVPPALSPRIASKIFSDILGALLGPHGEEEILSHPWARLHVLTSACRGPLASENKFVQLAAVIVAGLSNMISRRTLELQLRRTIFHNSGGNSPFQGLADFPTDHQPLTPQNIRPALLATSSIPIALQGVKIPGHDAAMHRDGGTIDYHLNLDFGAGSGLVFYPHFYPHIVPGWFDKMLAWRRGRPSNFSRALLLCPSDEFIASLPNGKIPDRDDYMKMKDDDRNRAWRQVVKASDALADELRELVANGRIADRVQPL